MMYYLTKFNDETIGPLAVNCHQEWSKKDVSLKIAKKFYGWNVLLLPGKVTNYRQNYCPWVQFESRRLRKKTSKNWKKKNFDILIFERSTMQCLDYKEHENPGVLRGGSSFVFYLVPSTQLILYIPQHFWKVARAFLMQN